MHISEQKKKNHIEVGNNPCPSFWIEIHLQGSQWGKQTLSKMCRGWGLRESHLQVTAGDAPWGLGNVLCVGALLKHPISLHKTACQHYPPPSLGSRIREELMGSVLPFGSPWVHPAVIIVLGFGWGYCFIWFWLFCLVIFLVLWHTKFPRAVWILTWKAAGKETSTGCSKRELQKRNSESKQMPFCGE